MISYYFPFQFLKLVKFYYIVIMLQNLQTKEEKVEYDARGRPKRQAKRENINYAAMGAQELTEELKKATPDEEDKEIDEWMKLSDDLQWAPREA